MPTLAVPASRGPIRAGRHALLEVERPDGHSEEHDADDLDGSSLCGGDTKLVNNGFRGHERERGESTGLAAH